MPDENSSLDDLRRELDELDRVMLDAAAQRARIVRRVALAKAQAAANAPAAGPLFDRVRERDVHDRAAATAGKVGLPVPVARQIMLALLEHSHRIQENVSRERARAATDAARRIVIVGGRGQMGRRLGDALALRGHDIDAYDVDDPRDLPAVVSAADIVMVAVPMDQVEAVIERVGPAVRPGGLLCDINSLKKDACAAMERCCAAEVVGLHPMFGPTVHLLRRQKLVVCPVRPGPLTEWWRGELGAMGLEIIETDPATHDHMMAVVQVLVHFSTLVMGEALRRSGVSVADSLRFTSPIYRLELAFVGRLFAQSADLYAEIEMTNPEGDEVRRHFQAAAKELDSIIAGEDRDAFRATFDEVSTYFREFAGEAMELSDMIIDRVVERA